MTHHFVSGAMPTPVAGAEMVAKPSTSNPWKILTVTAKLVSSAVVGNRAPALEILDQQGTIVAVVPASGTQAASLTVTYSWYIGGAPSPGAGGVVGGFASSVLPIAWWPAGWSIASKTTNLDVGDQWSSPYMCWLQSDHLSVGELNALIELASH